MVATGSMALVQVPFHGDVLDAVQDGDKVWVSLRRCCENLGIDFASQLAKLKNKAWATIVENTMDSPDNSQRKVACIDLETLPGWLFSIDTRKIRESMREKLVKYQREAARVLADHFFRRQSASPSIESIRELIRGELTAYLRDAQPPRLGPIQALPRFTIEDRLHFKGWPHASERQRNQVRRLANSLLDLRYGETPDVYGRVLTYYGHQLAVLDEAIDRVKHEYEQREREGGGGLYD